LNSRRPERPDIRPEGVVNSGHAALVTATRVLTSRSSLAPPDIIAPTIEPAGVIAWDVVCCMAGLASVLPSKLVEPAPNIESQPEWPAGSALKWCACSLNIPRSNDVLRERRQQ
jgi:hypothetical protein